MLIVFYATCIQLKPTALWSRSENCTSTPCVGGCCFVPPLAWHSLCGACSTPAWHRAARQCPAYHDPHCKVRCCVTRRNVSDRPWRARISVPISARGTRASDELNAHLSLPLQLCHLHLFAHTQSALLALFLELAQLLTIVTSNCLHLHAPIAPVNCGPTAWSKWLEHLSVRNMLCCCGIWLTSSAPVYGSGCKSSTWLTWSADSSCARCSCQPGSCMCFCMAQSLTGSCDDCWWCSVEMI